MSNHVVRQRRVLYSGDRRRRGKPLELGYTIAVRAQIDG
jgi:hypothetical protein